MGQHRTLSFVLLSFRDFALYRSLFFLLLSTFSTVSQCLAETSPATSVKSDWQLVTLVQEFGEFETWRIDSFGRASRCKFNIGRLIEKNEILHPSDELTELVVKIGGEIEKIRCTSTMKPAEGEEERGEKREVLDDGPVVRNYCIIRHGDGYLISGIDDSSDLSNLVGQVGNELEKSGEALPLESGAVLWVWPPWDDRVRQDSVIPRTLVVKGVVPAMLLSQVGTFIPSQEIDRLPPELKGEGLIRYFTVDSFGFTLWGTGLSTRELRGEIQSGDDSRFPSGGVRD